MIPTMLVCKKHFYMPQVSVKINLSYQCDPFKKYDLIFRMSPKFLPAYIHDLMKISFYLSYSGLPCLTGNIRPLFLLDSVFDVTSTSLSAYIVPGDCRTTFTSAISLDQQNNPMDNQCKCYYSCFLPEKIIISRFSHIQIS